MPVCERPWVVVFRSACAGGGGAAVGQVFTFERVGWWNIVQVRMLHPVTIKLIHV